MNLTPAEVALFWSLVDRNGPQQAHMPTPCWVLRGSRDGRGYSRFVVRGRHLIASRVSFELTRGPLPRGKNACHECDYKPCVRPDHIFDGTHKQNMEDAARKGRTSRGEKRWSAKLTEDQVREARRLRAEGATYAELCMRFGLKSEGSMHSVVHGRKWAHVKTEVTEQG